MKAFLLVSSTLVGVSAASLTGAPTLQAQAVAQTAAPAAAPMAMPAPANDPLAIKRAFNLARDTGIKLNGGLGQYRPARCMYDSAVNNRCLAQRDASGMVFHFPGGAPGWQETGAAPTVVTILRVAPDGRAVTQQIYNGPPSGAMPR